MPALRLVELGVGLGVPLNRALERSDKPFLPLILGAAPWERVFRVDGRDRAGAVTCFMINAIAEVAVAFGDVRTPILPLFRVV